jgi:glycosyltransferase involved in cell wall biosynthesis
MRIAILSYEFPPDTAIGGIATYCQQLVELLTLSGHSVEVFTASNERSGSDESAGYRVNFVDGRGRERFPEKIVGIFKERHTCKAFDVVEGPEFGADGREVLKAFPFVPHVVKLHTPSELVRSANDCKPHLRMLRHSVSQMRTALGTLRRSLTPQKYRQLESTFRPDYNAERIEREYVLQCDFVTAPSQAMLDWSAKNWAVSRDRSMVVPNPYVPLEEMLTVPIREEANVVGYVGRIEYRKGVQDLVEAIPTILNAKPNTCFRFVGEPLIHPRTLERFDTYIRRRLRRFEDRISITGARPLREMHFEYAQIDVCVLPSLWENFPNACLEAMASARAVVGSSAGGIREMLGDSGGLLVPPRSPKVLAAAVVRFLSDSELRRVSGERARCTVIGKYSRAAVLPRIEQSYYRAIGVSRAKHK